MRHSTERTEQERLEQAGQLPLFPSLHRKGAGGYRKGAGRKRTRPENARAWKVYVTDEERAVLVEMLRRLRSKK